MLKNLFCRHKNDQEVICWHITHGEHGDEPGHLEIQYKCLDCGKYYFRYIKDIDEMVKFMLVYKDKELSETCRPVNISKQIFYS